MLHVQVADYVGQIGGETMVPGKQNLGMFDELEENDNAGEYFHK